MKKLLACKIVARSLCELSGEERLDYEVYDGDDVVAQGTSSSEYFVRHDAGGYHTKDEFDAKYPDGWEVSYNF